MWIYEGQPIPREAMVRAIEHETLRAGRIIGEGNGWVWVRLLKNKDGSVIRGEGVRPLTPEEHKALDDLLRTGAICQRVLRSQAQPRWALASID